MDRSRHWWITIRADGRAEGAFDSAEDAARDLLADERAAYAVHVVEADPPPTRGAVDPWWLDERGRAFERELLEYLDEDDAMAVVALVQKHAPPPRARGVV